MTQGRSDEKREAVNEGDLGIEVQSLRGAREKKIVVTSRGLQAPFLPKETEADGLPISSTAARQSHVNQSDNQFFFQNEISRFEDERLPLSGLSMFSIGI